MQSYCDAFKPEKAACFDAIVSNPPFFVNALRNDDAGKRMARHTDSLPYASLFRAVSLLLAEKGVFSCIIPTECLADFLAESYIFGLFLQQDIAVKTTPRKPAKRHLLSFGRQKPASPMLQEQVLTDEQGARSSWYQALTKDFYIK